MATIREDCLCPDNERNNRCNLQRKSFHQRSKLARHHHELGLHPVKQTGGGTHGALVTAPSVPAFRQAIHMVRRKGTVVLVGLPPGEFPTPIFDVVLGRITIRGSIVGGRQDLDEAIEFAAEGKVHSHYREMKLEDINQVFSDMKAGKLDGRTVMTSF